MRRPGIISAVGVVTIAILLSSLVLSIATASAYTTASLSTKSSLESNGNVVTFPDANLESVIRNALGKPKGDITAADLAGLTKLDGFSKGIADLTNIQYCVNLTYLDLRQNRITDISPLSKLTKLATLWLYDNRISDITPLSNLTGLVDLTIRANSISDISPLARLTGLKKLYLSENQITDISVLSKLTGLTNLYLSNNRIIDVSPLKSLVNLEELRLDSNQISDISPLVENSRLGKNDQLLLQGNNLNMQEGSPTLQHIITLERRGVKVQPASGQTTTATQDSDRIFWRIVWSAVAVVFILVLALRVFWVGRRRPSYEDDEAPIDSTSRRRDVGGNETHVYHHQQIRCPRCDGTGKVDPPPINRVFGIKWPCPKCDGKGWIFLE